MSYAAKRKNRISIQAAQHLIPIPVWVGISALLSGYGVASLFSDGKTLLWLFLLTAVITAAVNALMYVDRLRNGPVAPYILLTGAFIIGFALSFWWTLLALPLCVLAPVLASFYQNRRLVRNSSFIAVLMLVLIPLLSYLWGFGTFREGIRTPNDITSLLSFLSPLFLSLSVICVTVISVSVYTSRLTAYQRNMAKTIAKDDQLGVFNKSQFQIKLKYRLNMDTVGDYYLLVTDIMKFRVFNDMFGHDAGDKLLHSLAELLVEQAGPDGIVGRLADDHLICLIPKPNYNEEYLRSHMFHSNSLTGNTNYYIDIVCGVFEITDHRIAADIMCDRALMAARSKRAKKDGIAFYRESMLYDDRKDKEFLGELRVALEQNQFVPYLQAQCRADGSLVGAEVLTRWQHPTMGIVLPDSFVPLCEEHSLISILDKNIWEKACETLVDWDRRGFAGHSLSVNISPVDLYELDVFEEITAMLSRHGLTRDRLRLEITETATMRDSERLFSTIRKLREGGFTVEIDDFGSGYSSLGMLSDVEIDAVKLDRSFVMRLDQNNSHAQQVLSTVSALARSLNTKALVEGVETSEQIQILTELGYEYFQGYYFSRPCSVAEFERKFFHTAS